VNAARALARRLSRPGTDAGDLVSEAFARVLAILRRGAGPHAQFRPYLLTTLRHLASDNARQARMLEYSADPGERADARAVRIDIRDPALASLERALAARAFRSLPGRQRAILWHTAIEGSTPAEAAPLLGLTPNGAAALAYRAREGLRQAYLQAHIAEPAQAGCRPIAGRLGAWIRGRLSKKQTAWVKAHLSACGRCRALAAELRDLNA
jgi:RNA polymerase sigma factor (sigma-70 family)